MKFDPQKRQRRSIRLRDYDYSQSGGYFVTIVTHQRECLFGDVVGGEMRLNNFGKLVEDCWCAIPAHFPNVELGTYVVMPNHLHGIIVINDEIPHADADASAPRGTIYRAPTKPHRSNEEQFGKPTIGSIPTIIRTFKDAVTRCFGDYLNHANVWQRNYYEHVIRDPDDLNRIYQYIESNPFMWDEDNENPFRRVENSF